MYTSEKLKSVRIEKGLSQEALAKKCGMYASQIRKYESGKANPKIQTLSKIANALGVPVNLLRSDSDLQFEDLINITSSVFNQISPSPIYNSNEKNIISAYRKLNDDGQNVALERVEELTQIPKYQKTPPEEASDSVKKDPLDESNG